MGAGNLALFNNRNRDFAELLGKFGTILEDNWSILMAAAETGRAGTDDRGTYFNALVLGIGRPGDDAFGAEGGRIFRRRYGGHLVGPFGKASGDESLFRGLGERCDIHTAPRPSDYCCFQPFLALMASVSFSA